MSNLERLKKEEISPSEEINLTPEVLAVADAEQAELKESNSGKIAKAAAILMVSFTLLCGTMKKEAQAQGFHGGQYAAQAFGNALNRAVDQTFFDIQNRNMEQQRAREDARMFQLRQAEQQIQNARMALDRISSERQNAIREYMGGRLDKNKLDTVLQLLDQEERKIMGGAR